MRLSGSRDARFILAVLVSAGSGCGPGSVETEGTNFSAAYAFQDCAPWDGVAVSVYLTNAPFDSVSNEVRPPFLHLAIWRDAQRLPQTTITWPGEESAGAASVCSSTTECEAVPSGRVSVSGLASDSTMSGDYELRLADSTTMRGRFRARWIERRMLCG